MNEKRGIGLCRVEYWCNPGRCQRGDCRNDKAGANPHQHRRTKRRYLLLRRLGLRHDSLHRGCHTQIRDVLGQIHRRPQHRVKPEARQAEHRDVERLGDDLKHSAQPREQCRPRALCNIPAGHGRRSLRCWCDHSCGVACYMAVWLVAAWVCIAIVGISAKSIRKYITGS